MRRRLYAWAQKNPAKAKRLLALLIVLIVVDLIVMIALLAHIARPEKSDTPTWRDKRYEALEARL